MPDYDRIAPYYDFLSGLVFRQCLTNAESYFFSHLQDPASILFFGGGTGKALAALLRFYPQAKIHYLEASSRMISIASNRTISGIESVEFIHGDEQLLSTCSRQYDAIITPFVLDVFSEKKLEQVLALLSQVLIPGGNWIQTDFYVYRNSPWWQRALVSTMYLFFRVTAKQRNQKLADFDTAFKKRPLSLRGEKVFCSGMVKTVLYRKLQETDPSH